MTIHLYSRVSTKHQQESGLGIAGQQMKCLEFARQYSGHDIVIYADSGYSGSLDVYKRPQLNELMSNLKSGDMMLSYDSSRIARDSLVWINVEIACKKAGVEIILASGCNGESLETSLIRRIMAQVNEYSLNKMKERTKAALKAKSDQGYKLGAARYGYKHNDKRTDYVEVKEEQKVIAFVRKLRNEGCTWIKVVAELNDKGYTTRSGKRWANKPAYHVLRKSIA